ncbi:hypothetical protein D3C73_1166580 [compost metagenome]
MKWEQSSGTAVIVWGDVRVTIDTRKETITSERGGTSTSISPVSITRSSASLWIPLRSLLESSGQTIRLVSKTQTEHRIQSL